MPEKVETRRTEARKNEDGRVVGFGCGARARTAPAPAVGNLPSQSRMTERRPGQFLRVQGAPDATDCEQNCDLRPCLHYTMGAASTTTAAWSSFAFACSIFFSLTFVHNTIVQYVLVQKTFCSVVLVQKDNFK